MSVLLGIPAQLGWWFLRYGAGTPVGRIVLLVLVAGAIAWWWVGSEIDDAVKQDRAARAVEARELEDELRERSAPGPVVGPDECRRRLREGRACDGL